MTEQEYRAAHTMRRRLRKIAQKMERALNGEAPRDANRVLTRAERRRIKQMRPATANTSEALDDLYTAGGNLTRAMRSARRRRHRSGEGH